MNLGFVPSLLLGYLLRFMLPFVVALKTWSVPAVLVAWVVGRVTFKLADAVLLRRIDRAYMRWWEDRSSAPRPRVRSLIDRQRQLSGQLLRWAMMSLGAGVACTGLVLLARVVGGETALVVDLAAVAVVMLLLVAVLVVAMFGAMAVETLAPTVLGPASRSDYVVARRDVAALHPLLDTRSVRVVRDVWDLVRSLKP